MTTNDRLYHFGNKFKIFIGLNDKNSHTKLISTPEALSIVHSICCDYLKSFTIISGKSGYTNELGEFYKEDCLVIEVLNSDNILIEKVASSLRIKLNQESILIEGSAILYKYIK
ncbi:MAG: hypothetical protein ACRDD7_15285 [Peptostreptococcaceae bacterium]